MADLALFLAVLPCLVGLAEGVVYCVRFECARWRAARYVWPPMRTIEVVDEIPF